MSALRKLRAARHAEAAAEVAVAEPQLTAEAAPAEEEGTWQGLDMIKTIHSTTVEEQTATTLSSEFESKSSLSTSSQVKKKKNVSKSAEQKKSSAAAAEPKLEDWELDALQQQSTTQQSHTGQQSIWSAIQVDAKQLDAANELKSVFGSSVHREHSAGRQLGQQRRALTSIHKKKMMLCKPHENWPEYSERGTIKMERKYIHVRQTTKSTTSTSNIHTLSSSAVTVEDEDETKEHEEKMNEYRLCGGEMWQFVYTPEYDRLQQEYLSCVETHDPNAISYFARRHPFHADALLQMSNIFDSQSEFSTAHEFIERCVYMFECSFNPEFNLTSGTVRMDGERIENRPFFTALYRHAQMLGKKGCPRTALAVCKILLSLSPLLDPTCILQSIDYYILRCRAYDSLATLMNLDAAICQSLSHPLWYNITSNRIIYPPSVLHSIRPPMSFLPNFRFSQALATYYMEQERKQSHTVFNGTITLPTLPSSGGYSMLDEPPTPTTYSSSYYLQLAIVLFPECVKSLLSTIHEKQTDKYSGIFHKLTTLYQPSNYIDKLSLIYGERCASIWKNEKIIAWLLSHVDIVLSKLSDGTFTTLMQSTQTFRQTYYSNTQPIPMNLRQLQKSQYSDTVPHLPPELLLAQAHANHLDAQDDMHAQQLAAANLRPLPLDGNPLAVFLRSLMPWYVVGGQAQQAPGGFQEGDFVQDDDE